MSGATGGMWLSSGGCRRFQITRSADRIPPSTSATSTSTPTRPNEPKITSARVISFAGVSTTVTMND